MKNRPVSRGAGYKVAQNISKERIIDTVSFQENYKFNFSKILIINKAISCDILKFII